MLIPREDAAERHRLEVQDRLALDVCSQICRKRPLKGVGAQAHGFGAGVGTRDDM